MSSKQKIPKRVRRFRCDQCPKEKRFKSSQDLKTHTEKFHINDPFQCKVCSRSFLTGVQKTDHIRRHHTKEKPFKCTLPNCEKEFASTRELKSHSKVHLTLEEKLKFSCPQPNCSKKFSHRFMIEKHVNHYHFQNGYKCEECGKSFAMKETLNKHAYTHSSVSLFPCNQANCSKKFKTKENLSRHVKQEHTFPDFRPFVCSICNKGLKTKKGFRIHMNTHDPTSQKFECQKCPSKFTTKDNFNSHMKERHFGKQLKCPHCLKIFTQSSNLCTHIKRQHGPTAGAKLNKCYFCVKIFTLRQNMARHLRYHVGERPFKCQICPSKRFFQKQERENHHQTVHTKLTDRKKFTCSTCSQIFLTPTGLRNHIKLKYGDALSCTFCKGHFSSISGLNSHITHVHTKEKMYTCKKCSFSSAKIEVIRQHRLTLNCIL